MFDRLFGRDNDEDEDGVDEYALIRTAPDQTKVKSFDEPVQPAKVRLEEPDMKPGKYQLQEVRRGQFGRIAWKEEFGDWAAERDGTDRVEREVRQLRRELSERNERDDRKAQTAPSGSFDDPTERLAFQIVQHAVQSEEIMAAKGDEILDRALDQAFSSGEPSVDYEIDNELQATLHELRKNPKQVAEYAGLANQLTESLGESLGKGMREGVAGGGAGTDQRTETPDVERPKPGRTTSADVDDTDAGPSTLDGLAAAVDLDGVGGPESEPASENGDPYPDPADARDDQDSGPDEPASTGSGEVETGTGLHPETAEELREMDWNDLQKLASEEGINPMEYRGKPVVLDELERRLFEETDDSEGVDESDADADARTGSYSSPEDIAADL